MKFNSLIPELSVKNIKKSVEFYTSIGFKIMYERKEDKFVFLQLENNQLMIEEINNNWNVADLEYPFGRGVNISMSITNIDQYYKQVCDLNIKIFKSLTINNYLVNGEKYADKEFLIQDSDGYLLRFNC